MTQQQVDLKIRQYYYELHESYSKEIYYLRMKGSRLLQKIKLHEIKMNRRKQRNLKPYSKSIDLMAEMINELVKISAFIETYTHFQMTMQPMSNLFHVIVNDCYTVMLRNIVSKIHHMNRSIELAEAVDFIVN